MHPELGLSAGRETCEVPDELEPLAQSVLTEAVRNARKHADPTSVEVSVQRRSTTRSCWRSATTASADGRARRAGMGLRLAALEALQAGGVVEFGEREPGVWRVRLVVPLGRA